MRVLTWLLLAVVACSGETSEAAGSDTSVAPNEDDRAVTESTLGSSSVPVRDAADTAGRTTVLIVGTSLTAGLGLEPEDAYPAVLQRLADAAGYRANIVAAGVSGETSAGALRRIDWLLQRPADVIVIESGANDGLRGLDIDSTRANLQEILRRAAAARPAARLFLIQMEAPPNLGPRYTTAFRAMFPEVASRAGAGLIPFLLDSVAGVPEMNQGDGIHPNEQGSVVVARNVWRYLEPELRGGPSR